MLGAAACGCRYQIQPQHSSAAISLLNPGTPEIPACLRPDLSPTSAETTTRCLKKHQVQAVTPWCVA
jgi:hypothetical protein